MLIKQDCDSKNDVPAIGVLRKMKKAEVVDKNLNKI